MRRRLVVLVLVALAAPAGAQEKKRAIVVPTELGGFFSQRSQWRYEYNRALENRLRSARFDVAGAATLSPAETTCREADCLAAIADAHHVDVVVAARANNNEQRLTSYGMRVIVAERPAPGAAAVARTREKTCENCTESQVRDALATLLSATLANEPEPVEPKPPEPPTKIEPKNGNATEPHHQVEPLKPPPIDPKVAEQEHRRRWIYRGTGIGVGALGLLGVYQGFAELSHNGDHVVQNGQTYRENTTKSQALFFTLGWGGVVAGGILSAIGWWPKKKDGRAVTVVPEVSPTGARLQLDFTF